MRFFYSLFFWKSGFYGKSFLVYMLTIMVALDFILTLYHHCMISIIMLMKYINYLWLIFFSLFSWFYHIQSVDKLK